MKKASRILAFALALCLTLALGTASYAAEAGASWADYQDYLYNASVGNAPDAQEWHDQVYALSAWEDIDMSVSPWDMIFSDQGPNLTTWAEFQATGSGAGSAVVGSTMDASGASAEPAIDMTAAKGAGMPSADKASGVPSGSKDAGVPAAAAEGQNTTWLLNGVEVPEGTAGAVAAVTDALADTALGSFTNRNDGPYYRVGLYIVGGEVQTEKSVTGALVGGSYSGTEVKDVTITSQTDDFGGIFVDGKSDVTISNANISFTGIGDGNNNSDFSARGAAIAVFDHSNVTIENSKVYTEGFVRTCLIADEGSHVFVENSTFTTLGFATVAEGFQNVYEGYADSANQSKMLSPPWVLGLMGWGRTMNALGGERNVEQAYATIAYYNSTVQAGGWGILSTDACSDIGIYVIDSKLENVGTDTPQTGYGAYNIGGSEEYFYGATVNPGTYAIIFTGSSSTTNTLAYAKFASSNGVIDVVDPANGEVLKSYTGAGKVSEVNSMYGFMYHGGGNKLELLDGTVVNADRDVITGWSGDTEIIVDDAVLNAGTGVILQVLDNPDGSAVGMGDMSTMGFNDTYDGTRIGELAAGYPGVDYAMDGKQGYATTTMTMTNGDYAGDIFNASGYFLNAQVIDLTLGQGAKLTGAVSATSCVHVDEQGQQHNTWDMKTQYYYMAMVENQNFYNGANDINVTLKDGAQWIVTEPGVISYLSVDAASFVLGTVTEQADGSLLVAPSDTELSGFQLGKKAEAASKSDGMPSADKASGVPSGEAAKDAGVPSAEPAAKDAGVPAAEPAAAEQTMSIGGVEFKLTVYTIDGVEYVKLADLQALTAPAQEAAPAAKDAGVPATAAAAPAGEDTFALFIEYMKSMLQEDGEGNDDFKATLEAATPENYDPTAMPYEMFISMGALGYEDFCAYYAANGAFPAAASFDAAPAA